VDLKELLSDATKEVTKFTPSWPNAIQAFYEVNTNNNIL